MTSADLFGSGLTEAPFAIAFEVSDRRSGATVPVALQVPGRTTPQNALAAIAAAQAVGVSLAEAAAALAGFKGLRRRFELVGTANGVTVIDDFGHNPDKIAATLRTLHAFPGRLLLFFQPHGYGPLRTMKDALIAGLRARHGGRRRADHARPGLLWRHHQPRGRQRRHRRRRRRASAATPSMSPTAPHAPSGWSRSPGPATGSSSWARATTR